MKGRKKQKKKKKKKKRMMMRSGPPDQTTRGEELVVRVRIRVKFTAIKFEASMTEIRASH